MRLPLATPAWEQAVSQRETEPRKRAFPGLSPYETFTLAAGLTAPGEVSLADATQVVLRELDRAAAQGRCTPFTARYYSETWVRLTRYLADQAPTLGAVSPIDLNDFIVAPLAHGKGGAARARGQAPSGGTQSLRRAALRACFNVLIRAGYIETNPAAACILASAKRISPVTPLTPSDLCTVVQYLAGQDGSSYLPALVAVCSAGAALTESAYLTADHLDLAAGLLYLPGMARKCLPRRVPLAPWQVSVLGERLTCLANPATAGQTLAASCSPAGRPQAHVSAGQSTPLLRLLANVLPARRPALRATAFQAYAANAAYAEAGLETAQHVIGARRAASAEALIDREWQTKYSATVRGAAS